MTKTARGNSKILPITSAEEVRHFVGPVEDHTIAEILETAPTSEDLEVAFLYAQGLGDVPGQEGHDLSGKPARIYEILIADDAYQVTEH